MPTVHPGQSSLVFTPLHSSSLLFTPLHSSSLLSTPLHSSSLFFTPLPACRTTSGPVSVCVTSCKHSSRLRSTLADPCIVRRARRLMSSCGSCLSLCVHVDVCVHAAPSVGPCQSSDRRIGGSGLVGWWGAKRLARRKVVESVATRERRSRGRAIRVPSVLGRPTVVRSPHGRPMVVAPRWYAGTVVRWYGGTVPQASVLSSQFSSPKSQVRRLRFLSVGAVGRSVVWAVRM